MSHFTVLVIGENAEEQLAPYDESIVVDKYKREIIAEEDKQRFVEFCTTFDEKRGYTKISEAEVVINKELSFDELYAKYGENWNGNSWEKDENGEWSEYSTYNPNSKWDWYQLGGRWAGYFKVKPLKLLTSNQTFDAFMGFSAEEMEGFVKMFNENPTKFAKIAGKYNGKGDALKAKVKELANQPTEILPEFEVGEGGVFNNVAEKGYADSILKKYIDFDSMREDSAKKASENYDIAMKIIGHLPENKTWDEYLKDESYGEDFDKRREDFWNQPRCLAWKEEQQKDFQNFPFSFYSSPDNFLISKEEYIQKAKNTAISTFAVVKDGKWYEKGKMGWWGITIGEKDNWEEEFGKLIDSVPDDTLLSIYDCHI